MGDTLPISMRLAVSLPMAFLAPDHAALTVCNKSAHGVRVAVGIGRLASYPQSLSD